MRENLAGGQVAETGSDATDSWLQRALARRAAELRDGSPMPGARFNSYI